MTERGWPKTPGLAKTVEALCRDLERQEKRMTLESRIYRDRTQPGGIERYDLVVAYDRAVDEYNHSQVKEKPEYEGWPSREAVAYAVEPCAQWHKENPGQPRFIIWRSERFARESANDTGGVLFKLVAAATLVGS